MITVTGTFTVKQDKIAAIVAGAQAVQSESLKNDEGCIEYKFHQLADNPADFFVYEVWNDTQSLDKHAASTHFKRFAQSLEGNLESELSIKIYSAL